MNEKFWALCRPTLTSNIMEWMFLLWVRFWEQYLQNWIFSVSHHLNNGIHPQWSSLWSMFQKLAYYGLDLILTVPNQTWTSLVFESSLYLLLFCYKIYLRCSDCKWALKTPWLLKTRWHSGQVFSDFERPLRRPIWPWVALWAFRALNWLNLFKMWRFVFVESYLSWMRSFIVL